MDATIQNIARSQRIEHPGPLRPARSAVVAATAVPLRFTLEPGSTVEEGVARGFAAAGCAGGYVTIAGGWFAPFRYVIPAGSNGPEHAAWYSETLSPDGPVTIEAAGAIVGKRDGRTFIHCHGLWSAEGEDCRMGHMLPFETEPAEPVEVTGIGVRQATFEARPDPETNFTLFEPVSKVREDEADAGDVLLVTVRPNEDISLALEAIAAERGIRRARVHGIGSLVGVAFDDGRIVPSYATELLVTDGRIEPSPDGQARAILDIAIVDMHGGIFEGRLARGDNPVCVTFELLIDAR